MKIFTNGSETHALVFPASGALSAGDYRLTFSLDRERLAVARGMNFPGVVPPREESWLAVVWGERETRALWIGVVGSAIAAGAAAGPLALRLLRLLPVAYLAALVALYVRLPHPFSNRMLIPIVPVACLASRSAASSRPTTTGAARPRSAVT